MTNAEALEIAIAKTGHERFRALVAENPDAYWPAVRRIAAGGASRPEPPLPGVLTRAAGLASAVAAYVTSDAPPLPPEAVAARLAVCEGCDHFRPSDRRCGGTGGCGCYVDVKASRPEWDCPLGRWPRPASA